MTQPGTARFLGVFLPALFLLATTALGQSHQPPFHTLSLQLSGTANVGTADLHTYWNPSRGGEFNVVTPFYWGFVEAGVSVHQHERARRSVPRFDAALVFLGWGPQLQLGSRFTWYNGFRIGNYVMRFDEDTFSGTKTENELSVAYHSRAAFQVTDKFGVFVSGMYQRTFTFVRLNLVFVSAGLSYTFGAPGWLQTFLQ